MSGTITVPTNTEELQHVAISPATPNDGDSLQYVASSTPPAWTPRPGPASIINFYIPDHGAADTQFIQPIGGQPRGFVIRAGTYVRMPDPNNAGQFLVWSITADMTIADAQSLLDVGTAFAAGQDYYIYLKAPATSGAWTPSPTDLAVSLNATNPAIGTTANTRQIGGFHTLCVSVGTGLTYLRGGTTVSHELNGFLSGDILPLSLWDLRHRAPLSPAGVPQRGMVFERYLGFWCDIYLQSGTGLTTNSAFQGAITNTRQYGDHVEDLFCVGKRLLMDEEFAAAACGSNEQTNVQGGTQAAAQNGGAGGRVDTNGRRMISYCGCEEMAGSYWQWLQSNNAAAIWGSMNGATDTSGTQGTIVGNPYGTAGAPASTPQPSWQSGNKGALFNLTTALLAGGAWNSAAGCGSRARSAANARSGAFAVSGGRGRVLGP